MSSRNPNASGNAKGRETKSSSSNTNQPARPPQPSTPSAIPSRHTSQGNRRSNVPQGTLSVSGAAGIQPSSPSTTQPRVTSAPASKITSLPLNKAAGQTPPISTRRSSESGLVTSKTQPSLPDYAGLTKGTSSPSGPESKAKPSLLSLSVAESERMGKSSPNPDAFGQSASTTTGDSSHSGPESRRNSSSTERGSGSGSGSRSTSSTSTPTSTPGTMITTSTSPDNVTDDENKQGRTTERKGKQGK